MSKDFNAVEFIKQRLAEYDPLIDTRPSTALYDLFLKPMTYMIQPLLDDSTQLAQSQSIANIELMTEEEADLLVSNYFITRRVGAKASGYVRVYFSSPVTILIPQTSVFVSSAGLRFISTDDISYDKETMALNSDGGYYYASIPVEAEDYGTQYSVPAGDIVSTESEIPNSVKVSNIGAFVGGEDHEDNATLKARAEEAITTRNLLSKRSINTLLLEEFPYIKDLLVVGFYDKEMMRDIISTEIDSTKFDLHIGGAVDIYAHTARYVDETADSAAISNIAASPVRWVSRTGNALGDNQFTDDSATYTKSAIEPGFILTIQSGIAIGDYTIASVASTVLTVTPPIGLVDDNIAYTISDPSSQWKPPVIAIDRVDILDSWGIAPTGLYLYDGRSTLVAPNVMASNGLNAEMACDFTGGVHCVYSKENDRDVWYTKLSNAGIVEIQPLKLSHCTSTTQSAKNPDFSIQDPLVIDGTTIDPNYALMMVYQDTDASTNKYGIYGADYTLDGTMMYDATAVIFDGTTNYSNPVSTSTPLGTHVFCIANDATIVYQIFTGGWSLVSPSHSWSINCNGTIAAPDICDDGTNTYLVYAQDNTAVCTRYFDSSALEISGAVTLSTDGTNIDPAIAIDSSSSIYVIWNHDTTEALFTKFKYADKVLEKIVDTKKATSFTGYTRTPRIAVDDSDMVHIVAIEDVNNSGDVHYMKYANDLTQVLVEDVLVQDQYNNANYVAIAVDTDRRPHMIWDSFSRQTSKLYYTKRQSQDYRLISVVPNYRYSTQEVVNIFIDPYYAASSLRFNYRYSQDIQNIDEYVTSKEALDRIVCANYAVKSTIPAFIDITLTYGGEDNTAAQIITDYINGLSTYELTASEIISILPISLANKVNIPFTMHCERHDIDGNIVVTESQDQITEPRTSRFIARNIVVL